MRRALRREYFSSQRRILDLLDDLGAHAGDVAKALYDGLPALERWANGRSAFHVHVGVRTRWNQIDPGDYCAYIQPFEASGRRIVPDDLAADAVDSDVQGRRGGIGEQHYSVLVPIRHLPKKFDCASPFRASIRLVPLEQCEVGPLGDSWEPLIEVGPEDGRLGRHRKGNATFLMSSKGGTPHSDQSPDGMIERGSKVSHNIAEDNASFEREIRDLCGDEVGDQYAAAQAPLQPYFGLQGFAFVIRHELSVERLRVFETPLNLQVAALEGLHDA